MARSPLLADMNISPATVECLRSEGWDIVRVPQLLPRNATDADVLEHARRGERCVVTQDLDFSAILALNGQERPSLVTLRLSVSDPEAITQRLRDVLPQIGEALRDGCAVVVEDATIRIRRLPIR